MLSIHHPLEASVTQAFCLCIFAKTQGEKRLKHWIDLGDFFQYLIQNFLNNSMILPQKLIKVAQKIKFLVILTTLINWKIAQTKSLQPAVFPSFFADFSSYYTVPNKHTPLK